MALNSYHGVKLMLRQMCPPFPEEGMLGRVTHPGVLGRVTYPGAEEDVQQAGMWGGVSAWQDLQANVSPGRSSMAGSLWKAQELP